MKKILLFFALHFCLFNYSQNIAVKPRLNSSENERQPQFPNIVQNNSNHTLPYPIIFIHGLNSNSEVWIDLRTQLINSGLNFGGRIDFCLNDDGNNNVANKLVYPTPNADIALYTDYINDLSVGDFYFLNFDVNNIGELFPSDDGSAFNDVLSNESAIVKQGLAVKLAIQIVLQKTGRDKVILMGHSMGGLASREYIQNPINWQQDGQHHVAKLVTTGTPHGGFTGVNLSPTIDSSSEAYRDLKKNYVYGGNGVYLFGGIENYPNMLNNLLYTFYNVDVNCNGVDADNSNIIGLNYKGWITDIDYSYIVGMCDNCNSLYPGMPGDGIVKDIDANLSNFSNFLPLPINEFIYTANALNPVIGLHTDLPKAVPVSFKGLDEPNEYNLSYGINLNQTYKGFITEQPPVVGGYSSDYDDYKINIATNGNYSINVTNSYYNSISYRILDSSFNILSTNTILANSQNSFQHNLTTGSYYIEFISVGNLSSYNYPYTFLIQDSLSNDDSLMKTELKAYPNPFTNQLTIEGNEPIFKVEIFNLLGQKVKNIEIKNSTEKSVNIELSELAQGNYIAKVTSENSIKTIKINKN